MFNIADYLKRTIGIIDKSVLYHREISAILKKHTGITKENFFEVKNGVMQTNLTPGEKMMLLIKKEGILEELKPFDVFEIR
jgi:hypothetical protein